MFTRMVFLLSALFWVTMNYLLWRSEYGGASHQGGAVPTEVVWHKIITSPDNSSLDILHHGEKVGYVRWVANERFNPTGGTRLVDGLPVAGPYSVAIGYRLDLEGNVAPESGSGRIHFDLTVDLGPDRAWRKMTLRLSMGSDALVVHSRAIDHNVHLLTEQDGNKVERVLTFDELQNPRALAEAFAVPLPLPADMLELPDMGTNTPGGLLPLEGLDWEARSGWISFGHASIRAYRLQTQLLDRWQIVIMVSPVGEILRVELPDDWVLASDQTGGL
jgi:hypothetical protein